MLKRSVKPVVLSAAFALSLAAGLHHATAEEMESVSAVSDVEHGIVLKQVSDVDSSYCHIKYMAFTERSLKNGDLEFNPSDIVDWYGSCAFDPKDSQEVKKQISFMNRGTGDGSNDSGSDD
jgi:hypothetical protein